MLRVFRISHHVSRLSARTFVSIGDKVPINFMKEGSHPVIKEDKEYPDWVFTLDQKLPGKSALMKRIKEHGLESLQKSELRRMRRLLILEKIKEGNTLAGMSKN